MGFAHVARALDRFRVVGDHVHLAPQGHLPGQSDQDRVLDSHADLEFVEKLFEIAGAQVVPDLSN